MTTKHFPGLPAAATLLALVTVVAGGCAAAVPQRCSRVELGSGSTEAGLRVHVDGDDSLRIDDADDRLVVAFTVVGDATTPLFLVHHEDGRETGRWELKPGKPSGVSTRCAMALPGLGSTCSATFAEGPVPLGGEWTIEPGANTILEAGLSARLCR